MTKNKRELISENKYLKVKIKDLQKELSKIKDYQRGIIDAIYYLGGKK